MSLKRFDTRSSMHSNSRRRSNAGAPISKRWCTTITCTKHSNIKWSIASASWAWTWKLSIGSRSTKSCYSGLTSSCQLAVMEHFCLLHRAPAHSSSKIPSPSSASIQTRSGRRVVSCYRSSTVQTSSMRWRSCRRVNSSGCTGRASESRFWESTAWHRFRSTFTNTTRRRLSTRKSLSPSRLCWTKSMATGTETATERSESLPSECCHTWP